MADETRNIIHNSYATRAAAAAAMGDKNLAMVTADNGLVYDKSGTQVVFPNEAMLADTTGVNGAAIIGAAGITGVTPTGGSLGGVGSVQDMLEGLAVLGVAKKVAFTMSMDGFASPITALSYYVLLNNICFLYIPNSLTGTSTQVYANISGWPTAAQPADTSLITVLNMVDSATAVIGQAAFTSPAIIALQPFSVSGSRIVAGTFTASGSKGIAYGQFIVYSVL